MLSTGTVSNWYRAQEACQSINGNLATLNDSSVNSFVYSLMSSNPVWFGATRPAGGSDVKDGWTWVDGTPWGTVSDWDPSQPDGDNGWASSQQNFAVAINGKWHDSPFGINYQYVCQKKCKGN